MESFETFREVGGYEITNLKWDKPSCFNGMVRVKKYRITIEEVPESDNVIVSRIKKLWDNCDNHHHRQPLLACAKKYGVDLYNK